MNSRKYSNHKKWSMSRVGHCIDNGPTKGFWVFIKSEMYCMLLNSLSISYKIDKIPNISHQSNVNKIWC